MNERAAGRFIVLEGPEGGGKSTQTARLVRTLRDRGRQAVAVRDPGSTPVSERIREVLLDARHVEMDVRTEVFLYMASRAQMVAEAIRPALEAGCIVVSDRFIASTVAYQGYAGGFDPEAVWQLGRLACGDVEPDLTVILDVPVEAGFARLSGERDRMEAKDRAYHERVREGYLAMARARPEAFAVVDATRPPEAVAEAILEAVDRVL